MNIIPAIIGKNIGEIKEKIGLVRGVVNWVQIDIMDGVFTPQKSWPFSDGEWNELVYIDDLRRDEIKVEFHLMVENPELILDNLIKYGADRILIHNESKADMRKIQSILEYEEIELGVSLKMETDFNLISKNIDIFDEVQFMSIAEIGSYGFGFDDRVIEKIKKFKEDFPGVLVSVDGGVNENNILKLKEAGVENFVVGSAIFGEGKIPSEEVKRIEGIIK